MLTKEELTSLGMSDDAIITKVVDLSKTSYDTATKARDKAHYGVIEEKVKSITGLEPDYAKEEKATDFMVRAFSTHAEKSATELNTKITEHESTITGHETTISDLNTKLKDGASDETLKENHEALKTRYSTLEQLRTDDKTSFDDKLKEHVSANDKLQFNNSFNSSLPGFDKEANEYEIKGRVTEARNMLEAYKYKKYDENGQLVVSDNEIDFKPAKEVLGAFEGFKEILPKDRSKSGGGSGTDSGKGGDKVEGALEFADGTNTSDKLEMVEKQLRDVEGLNPASTTWDVRYKTLMGEIKKEEDKK